MRRDPASAHQVRIPAWLLVLLATLFGIAGARQHVLSMGMPDGQVAPFAHGMAMRMPFWYLWALAVPMLQWFARRFPLERMRWLSGAALHICAGFAFSMVQYALELGVQRMLPQRLFTMGDPYPGSARQFIANGCTQNLGIYTILLTAVYCADYYARFRERELAASQLQAQLARAQLQALRMQLNPHFLFNALNSISMLVRGGRNPEAVRMLAGLGDLLRSVLEEDRPSEVPLRDELHFLERYLEIEQIRAGRLKVTMDVAAETMDARVPNLILQPIVENAIRHGIARSSTASLVEIGARRENGSLLLSVRDDGPGVGEDGREGVGLRNTRARLAGMYGDAQGLELANVEEGGALVTIRLPFLRGDAVEEAPR
ncbi:MAG TPA: histidine kinase [Longimicrobium sp.]|nr:histidine kinase [Longimicrobium sp.]